MGHMIPYYCPRPGKFGEAHNIQRVVDVPAAQSWSGPVLSKMRLFDPWALQRCVISSANKEE